MMDNLSTTTDDSDYENGSVSPIDEEENKRIEKSIRDFYRKRKEKPKFLSEMKVQKTSKRKGKKAKSNSNASKTESPSKRMKKYNPKVQLRKKRKRKVDSTKILYENELTEFDKSENGITKDIIVKKINYSVKDGKNLKKAMTGITHLRLEEQKIERICTNTRFFSSNLRVLYLDRNFIKKIENLNILVKITHLYLNHNRISKLEGLDLLPNLQKLYISNNRIRRLENLSENTRLTELYIQNQENPSDDDELDVIRTDDDVPLSLDFTFDPNGMPPNLRVLDCSNCGIVDILPLIQGLRGIQDLNISRNRIEDLLMLKKFLTVKYDLYSINVSGNPFTQLYTKWRDEMILSATDFLSVISGEEIKENTRMFVKNKHRAKVERRGRKSGGRRRNPMDQRDQPPFPAQQRRKKKGNNQPHNVMMMKKKRGINRGGFGSSGRGFGLGGDSILQISGTSTSNLHGGK